MTTQADTMAAQSRAEATQVHAESIQTVVDETKVTAKSIGCIQLALKTRLIQQIKLLNTPTIPETSLTSPLNSYSISINL
jgi:hypothetical protein